jgi:predicted ATP-dependent endonuclease of OLD family
LSLSNSQIIICSHSPLFIPGDSFEKIRLVCEQGEPSETKIKRLTYDSLAAELHNVGEKLVTESGMVAKLYPSLNPVVNEMFFCKKLILVEGHEDIAYISSYLLLTDKMNEFRRHGCHIVPVEGKSKLIKPLAMAKLLDIPTMVIYDSDTDKTTDHEVPKHKKDNKAILALKECSDESEWPDKTIIRDGLTAWQTNLTVEIMNELGDSLKKHEDAAALHYGNAGGLKKNPLAIAKTLELAWNDGTKSQLLIELTDRIVEFIKK